MEQGILVGPEVDLSGQNIFTASNKGIFEGEDLSVLLCSPLIYPDSVFMIPILQMLNFAVAINLNRVDLSGTTLTGCVFKSKHHL